MAGEPPVEPYQNSYQDPKERTELPWKSFALLSGTRCGWRCCWRCGAMVPSNVRWLQLHHDFHEDILNERLKKAALRSDDENQ